MGDGSVNLDVRATSRCHVNKHSTMAFYANYFGLETWTAHTKTLWTKRFVKLRWSFIPQAMDLLRERGNEAITTFGGPRDKVDSHLGLGSLPDLKPGNLGGVSRGASCLHYAEMTQSESSHM